MKQILAISFIGILSFPPRIRAAQGDESVKTSPERESPAAAQEKEIELEEGRRPPTEDNPAKISEPKKDAQKVNSADVAGEEDEEETPQKPKMEEMEMKEREDEQLSEQELQPTR